jgi:hypothetical protein
MLPAQEQEVVWWRTPAWLSLFLTMLLHLCVAAFIYGRMAAKVDVLEHQNDLILQHLLHEDADASQR